MKENDSIAIRSIQHYLYCPHRWGLLEIGNVWAENYFVTKANLFHARVHNADIHYARKNVRIINAVEVYNDDAELNIHGVLDCLEVDEKNNKVCIVEYKPTKPKDKEYNADDMLQVFAQKLCVDKILSCNAEACIYYADVKRRVVLPFADLQGECLDELKRILSEMRAHLRKGIIPNIPKGQRCQGCSLKDLCMPKEHGVKNIRQAILESAYA